MLITFKETGCSKCPFNASFETDSCNLSKDHLEGSTLDLVPNYDKKPDGCPFKNGKKVEVVAKESE